MSVQNSSRRILTRGNESTFKVGFFADSSNTIPLVPLDALQYPAYSIFDPENQLIQSGIGQATNTPGQYKAIFLVPVDAMLSGDLSRWRIEWSIVDINLRQMDFVEDFDVNDVVITASETREQKSLCLAFSAHRLQLRLGSRPVEVQAKVFAGQDNLISTAYYPQNMLVAQDGDSQVYYFDVPPCLLRPGGYQVIWGYRYNIQDPMLNVFQAFNAVTPSVLGTITDLRMLMDKFQKRLGTVQAYEDSDLNNYLVQGHNLVNAYYPSTSYGYGYMPGTLQTYVLLMAGWYGLTAQNILNADLSLNFSGQSVSFDYDQSSTISETLGKWQEFTNSTLPAAKMALVRKSQSVGTVAGRWMSFKQPSFTFKVAQYNNYQIGGIVQDLIKYGLLW